LKSNIVKLFLFFLIAFNSQAKGYLKYSQAADVFNIIDHLSQRNATDDSRVIYKYWTSKFPLSSEDNDQLDNFKKIRSRFVSKNGEFDAFSIAFYRANSVDEAMKNLKKVIKKEELKTIVKVLRHFRVNASKLIGQSQGFKGKIVQLDKGFKKKKVYKAYDKAFKFFGLKKNYKTKVYFLWWPEDRKAKIDIIQNIVYVKIHPLNDLEKLLTSRFMLDTMVKSLFSSLPKVHKDNFEKTVFDSCEKENFYTVLSYSMGELPFQKLTKKKKYNPFVSHFDKKKDNVKAILFSELYESETKLRKKFFGEFPNKIRFLCEQLDF
jgi:hypothetical protein